jgi:hypothetical protein
VDHPGAWCLGLEGVSAPGRHDPKALCGESLVGVELVHSRIEATFAPAGWGGLRVRASWSSAGDAEGIDLEVQVSASSVGELKGVEVWVATRLLDPVGAQAEAGVQPSWVEPRDRRAAALSYDGRENREQLACLTTLPVPGPGEAAFAPVLIEPSWPTSRGAYLELVHPHDVARRIVSGVDHGPVNRGAAAVVRYGLFGHDVEKGIIVRGRLRGLWIDSTDLAQAARHAYAAFLTLPPPLGP